MWKNINGKGENFQCNNSCTHLFSTFFSIFLPRILRIYPNGKEEDNGEDHVSLYLKLARSLDGCDVNATYKFFVYNYKRKMYLVVQGFEVQHFDDVEDIEHGISRVLSLNDFLNPSNGFILNGRCKFGVEVTVMRPTARDACLLDLNVQRRSRFTWPIRNFTESLMYDYLDSRPFTMEGRRWFLRMYPRGHGPGFEKSISIYLHLCDFSDLRNGRRLYITMELRAKNLMNEPDATQTVFACYNISSYASGHCDLVALSDLHNSEKGFKLDDMLILEVELKQQYLLEDL
ncbi:hypothetical protein Ancab_040479 [Ancistrocladus abbreviatus]